MSELIVSISGIRGIIGDSLTPDVVVKYASAFAQYCDRGTIVIGYDGRPSGRQYIDLARAALALSGSKVIYLGIVPTPTVQLAVEHFHAQGGISITASHNPAEWNGMKFLDSTGVFLDQKQNDAFLDIFSKQSLQLSRWDSIGTYIQTNDFCEYHVQRVLRMPHVNISAIRAKQFKIVVDAVNASGSNIVVNLLEKLNCEVIPLHCDCSGEFPHLPEPIPENLTGLGKAVCDYHADLGIAVDPDADRLVLFTENGESYGEEYTITTAVDSLLRFYPNSKGTHVVVNLSTTRAVEDVAKRYEAIVSRTPVGEINVVKKMRDLKAVIGGEGSGGVIVPAIHYGRDSLAGIILVLNVLSEYHGTISEYRASLPAYFITKKKFSLNGIDPDKILSNAITLYSKERINTEDGVRIDFDHGWVHLRKSNTEPIIRVIAEAKSMTDADSLADEIISKILPQTSHI